MPATYCKLVGDKKMAKGKYITINEVPDDDDWALIFDKQGDPKGSYIPKRTEESRCVPKVYTKFVKNTLALTLMTMMYLKMT